MLAVIGLALAACPPPVDIKVRWSDPIRAATFRHLLFRELRDLRDGADCPLYASDGILDFVDVAALGERDRAYRELAEDLRGAIEATPKQVEKIRSDLQKNTSGYSEEVRSYLLRFVASAETIDVREEREGESHLVYLQRWRGKQIVPTTAAFTFKDDSPDLARRVHRAVVDLYPELDTPPLPALSASQAAQATGETLRSAPDAAFHVRAGVPVQFDASASDDRQTHFADLDFEWTVGGAALPQREPTLALSFAAGPGAEARVVAVRVSDGRGSAVQELHVVVEPTTPPESRTEPVQGLGWVQGDDAGGPVAVVGGREVEISVEEDDGVLRWRWKQIGGPALGCSWAYEASCDDRTTLEVSTTEPRLVLDTGAPGLYVFEVVADRSGIASEARRIETLAVHRRGSDTAPLVGKYGMTLYQVFAASEPELALDLRLGLDGLWLHVGYATGFQRWRDEEAPDRLLIGGGLSYLEASGSPLDASGA